jgi:hypothetical protein
MLSAIYYTVVLDIYGHIYTLWYAGLYSTVMSFMVQRPQYAGLYSTIRSTGILINSAVFSGCINSWGGAVVRARTVQYNI